MHCKGIRRLALLCCFGIACLPLGGCSSAQNDRLRIAVIVKATDSDFWYSVQNGVSAAATEYNVEVSFEGPASEEDYSTQIAMIERAVENGVDAIVLSAIDYERVAASVTEAARRGVRVVAIDSAVGSPAVSRFIGTDNYAAGRTAGEAVRQCAPAGTPLYVGLVNFAEETENGRQRELGLREYLAEYPEIHIAAAVHADSNTESAAAAASALLREHPEINVLVGLNEWMSLGVGYAIARSGAAGRVHGIGFDANTVSVGMLETGEMDALIVQNPFAIGYLGVQYAAELVSGEAEPGEAVYTAVAVANRDNLYDENMQKLLFRF